MDRGEFNVVGGDEGGDIEPGEEYGDDDGDDDELCPPPPPPLTVYDATASAE